MSGYQIYRGAYADRLTAQIPQEGQPMYMIDTKHLNIGDGSTAGGINHPQIQDRLSFTTPTELAIASGVIAPTTQSFYILASEVAGADTLSKITATNAPKMLILQVKAGDTITLEHGTDTDDISLASGANATYGQGSMILLIYDETNSLWKDWHTTGGTPSAGSFASVTVSGDLTVDTNTLYVDSTNDRVGVGTLTPTDRFDVYHTTDATTGIRARNPNSGTSAIAQVAAISDGAQASFLAHGSNFTSSHRQDRAAFLGESSAAGLDLVTANASGDLRFYTGGYATSNERVRIDSTGNVGVGTTSIPYRFTVALAPTATSGTESSSYFSNAISLSGTPSTNVYAAWALASAAGSADYTGLFRGMVGQGWYTGSGSLAHSQGGYFGVSMPSATTGNITNAYGATGQIINGSSSGGVITHGYAFYAYNPSATGTITNTYGFYAQAMTAATNNYAIYTNAGAVRFGDEVEIVGSADVEQFIIKFNSTQTANGVEFQNSGGTSLVSINGDGELTIDQTNADYGLRINASGSSYDAAYINNSGTGSKALHLYSNGTGTPTALYAEAVGAGTTNTAGYFSATGATNNIGIAVENGGLLLGATARQTIGSNEYDLQVLGTAGADSGLAFARWSNNNGSASINFGKSRGATVGASGIVQDDDILGGILFYADDGANLNGYSAYIRARIDATPAAGDIPARLEFLTTASGASTSTLRMTIDRRGYVGIGSAPSAMLHVVGTTDVEQLIVAGNSTQTANSFEVLSSVGTKRFYVRDNGQVFAGYITVQDATNADGWLNVTTPSSAPAFVAYDGSTEIFRIADGGNVGINTTSPNTRLDVQGGITLATTTVNAATYDLLITDKILHVTYTSTGAVTSLTLPSAQAVAGRVITIKDGGGNAGTNNITVDTEGSETIDGSATLVISTNYAYVNLFCDGTNWFTW